MLVEIKVDGQVWIELTVKDQISPAVLKELELAYQRIVNQNKTSAVMRVHQLRKKYG
ncbi:MAG: hypothetical protein NWE92_13915 [Candidatus Bathyarchaeota archaeon]|nr:hypothetical protein [Candidatus Bathyarchaeota archaeon]